jgi:hypothetical protein
VGPVVGTVTDNGLEVMLGPEEYAVTVIEYVPAEP